MDRRTFIQGVSAGMALACLGCLAACSKSDDGTDAPPQGASFTVNLDNELTQVGDYLMRSGVLVARIGDGLTAAAFAAVQGSCPHQGFTLKYDENGMRFHCDNHGSNFSTSGAVINGPSTGESVAALKTYKVSVSGHTLTVKS